MESSCIEPPLYGEQRGGDLVDSGSRLATAGDDFDVWLELVDVGGDGLHADLHRFREIGLVDHHDLRAEEHVRMLAHAPWSFGDADDNAARLRPERKFRG